MRSVYLHAVDGVDLSIGQGKTLGLVGESGCGKSTLGRTLVRLIEPTGGEVYFEGRNILQLDRRGMAKERRKMQVIYQDPYSSLNPRMTVRDLIAEPILVNKLCENRQDAWRKVAKLMDTVGLAQRLSGAYPHELDGGRRQRIGVARALSVDPKFVVCDEPVSALDVSIQAQILNLLMDLQDSLGLTYLFITHDLSVVRHISDDVMVMYLGKCVERAPSRDLFRHPAHPYTRALLSAIPVPDVAMRGRRPEVVHGEIASPIDPKPGCGFAPRCPLAMEACTRADVPLTEVSPGHFAACLLARAPGADGARQAAGSEA
ncbi:MAG TPA: ABC transporter ATP-binding protein [Candidatus Limnocylindria bacterium]|nr:ABC transporter ATP-binding protein [Candidatus Limnocylindria bacterium]